MRACAAEAKLLASRLGTFVCAALQREGGGSQLIREGAWGRQLRYAARSLAAGAGANCGVPRGACAWYKALGAVDAYQGRNEACTRPGRDA